MTRGRFRRSVALATAAAALCAASACGAAATDDTLVLEFPSWQAADESFSPWWRELIAAYEAEHRGVDIDFYQVPFDSFVAQQTTRFAAGDPPDVVHLPASNAVQFAARGWLAPLDEQLATTDVAQTWSPLQEQMRWDGRTYGLLLLGYGYALFYNEQLLADAGVGVPTDPQQMLAAARAVSALSDDVFGFGATTVQNPDNYTEMTAFVVGNGGAWSQPDGRISTDDPAVLEGMRQYRDLVATAPPGIQSQQRNELFFNGQIAMVIDGPFLLSEVQGAPEEVRQHLEVAAPPFPVVPGGVSNSLHVPADADPETAAAVWDLIEMASRPEWQRRYTELTAVPAPRKGSVTAEALAATPELELFGQLADQAVDIFPRSPELRRNHGRVSDAVASAAIRLIASGTPVDEAAATLRTDLEGAGDDS
ncbi:ABC transporter substrate-binding protein [Pseudonocardia kunmingensis]|uniref:Carbohydrate ABC transporter substrate-binding protein (CUT1 family) n=1 Tax=Pseudonocardia kunmingensis TaxID=630975 RepID=A0A543DVZ9_9PSEU|nr:extracellular solute-binding protein [Pseudonocardia kunmingensis]TQM13520.1 carbohydrate ABC transporter substrate-binding protein (CUT1 family) [Pseudonocardia kunmingensis]